MNRRQVTLVVLVASVCIIGIQSHATLKPSQKYYRERFPSPLDDLQNGLDGSLDELNEISHGIGKSSSKISILLEKVEEMFIYLETLFSIPISQQFTCNVPGALPDPTRGFCYLYVTNPMLDWYGARDYCAELGGYLMRPLPNDPTIGLTLAELYPSLTTLSDSPVSVWIDGYPQDLGGTVGTQFVYGNGLIIDSGSLATTTQATLSDIHDLAITLPVPTSSGTLTLDQFPDTDVRGFICQFKSLTIFPPFHKPIIDPEDDTHVPHPDHMIDVEAVDHHYGEEEEGYGHEGGEYTVDPEHEKA